MLRIGITGGIGSGKTYICDELRAKGYPIYNCDVEAKRLMATDPSIRSALTALIGPDTYLSDGRVNRPVVAKYLFAHADNAAKINAIVHPVVKADYLQWSLQHTVSIMECAILFESGFDTLLDRIVLIYAPSPIRLQRAMERDKATRQQIESRMAQQIQDDEARSRADYILDHTDYSTTESEITKLINYIEKC